MTCYVNQNAAAEFLNVRFSDAEPVGELGRFFPRGCLQQPRINPVGCRYSYLRCRCFRSRSQPDVDLRCKRSMDGAFCGDLHQLRALFCGQRAGECDFDVDSVEHAFLGFALLAIFSVIRECRSETVMFSRGNCFRRAYKPTVMEVQTPRLASK